MKASEVLRAAHDYILEHGWTQGGFTLLLDGNPTTSALETGEAPDAAVCIKGSLIKVLRYPLSPRHIESYLEREADTFLGGIALWNDAPERTVDEVLDLLLRASKRAEQDEALS